MFGFLFVLLGLFILLVVRAFKDGFDDEMDVEVAMGMTKMLIGIFFLVNTTILIASYHSSSALCEEVKAVQRTVDNTRGVEGFENATLTKRIMGHNQSIKSAKYYNSTFLFDWYYCDCVDKMQPIKLKDKNKESD